MNRVIKSIKYLLGWTTLYTFGADGKLDPPSSVLKAIHRKTWFTQNSRKYPFRFVLHFLYYLAFGYLVLLSLNDKTFSFKVLALTGGLYIFYSMLIFIIRLLFFMITKHASSREIIFVPYVVSLAFGLSTLIYFIFFTPIFISLCFILSIFFSADLTLLIANTVSHSLLSVLQYWSKKSVS